MLREVFSPFGTDVAVYVAADGSDRVAIAANIHDTNGMSAFMQSSEAASRMADNGVIQPTLVLDIEAANEQELARCSRMAGLFMQKCGCFSCRTCKVSCGSVHNSLLLSLKGEIL